VTRPALATWSKITSHLPQKHFHFIECAAYLTSFCLPSSSSGNVNIRPPISFHTARLWAQHVHFDTASPHLYSSRQSAHIPPHSGAPFSQWGIIPSHLPFPSIVFTSSLASSAVLSAPCSISKYYHIRTNLNSCSFHGWYTDLSYHSFWSCLFA